MNFFKLAISVGMLLAVSSAAEAADWMTEDGGTIVCGAVKTDGTCWLSDIAADSSAIVLQQCKSFTIQVYGSGASIMPQTCKTTSCSSPEDLLATALTGDSPNAFATSDKPFQIIRIDWTSGGAAPDVSISCGR